MRRVTVAVVLSLAWPGAARAEDCTLPYSSADAYVWSALDCGSPSAAAYFQWFTRAYNVATNAWNNRGYNAPCDLSQPYAKFWLGAFIVSYGLSDDPNQWHSTLDYRRNAEAWPSVAHDPFAYSYQFGGWGGADPNARLVILGSNSFGACWNDNVVLRATTYAHEGQHFRTWDRTTGNQQTLQGHFTGPLFRCTNEGPNECDRFFPHGRGAFDVAYQQSHSARQLEVEYACDLAQFPSRFIPGISREGARISANGILAGTFINGPGFWCSKPVAFFADDTTTR